MRGRMPSLATHQQSGGNEPVPVARQYVLHLSDAPGRLGELRRREPVRVWGAGGGALLEGGVWQRLPQQGGQVVPLGRGQGRPRRAPPQQQRRRAAPCRRSQLPESPRPRRCRRLTDHGLRSVSSILAVENGSARRQ